MFFNSSSATFTSFSNNNNNPNQANPNNQTGIFSASPNISNNSLGNMPSQLPTVFGSAPGGGLIGNPQPSGGLFGNQIQQQSQAGGGLFRNQVQQQPQIGGLFGTQRDSQDGGTVGLIGLYHSGNYPRNIDNFALPSITNRPQFRGQTLDEIRMKDYFNLKNNTLNDNQRRTVRCAIYSNLTKINSDIHSHFSSTGLPPNLKTLFSDTSLHDNSLPSGLLFKNPQSSQMTLPRQITNQPTTLFGGNIGQATPASGSLFMNPQPSPLVTNIPTNHPSDLQSSSLPTQIPNLSNEPTVIRPSETKESSIKTVKPTTTAAKSENKILTSSNSGSFNYEFNKMLFASGLVQIMEKHNMTMPENLLDNTDFVAQLLGFLEQHNISLPTENIPQFRIDSVAQSLSDETSE